MLERTSHSDHGHVSVVGCLALIAVALLMLGTCGRVGHRIVCTDSVRSEAKSPDGRYVTETVDSDCGATEHATVIQLRRNRAFFSDVRDVFATSGGHDVRVTWEGNQQLIIRCPDCTKRDSTDETESKWRDVSIRRELSLAKD